MSIKTVDLDQKDDILREISLLKILDHENVIKVIDCYQTDQNYFVVTEFCLDGDLFCFLKKGRRLTESNV